LADNPEDYVRIEDIYDSRFGKDFISKRAWRDIHAARELYDSGKPLYPRKAIMDATQQLHAKSERIVF
jgi:hypothetical protein